MVQGMAGFENVKIERDLSEPKRAEYQGPFYPVCSESKRSWLIFQGRLLQRPLYFPNFSIPALWKQVKTS